MYSFQAPFGHATELPPVSARILDAQVVALLGVRDPPEESEPFQRHEQGCQTDNSHFPQRKSFSRSLPIFEKASCRPGNPDNNRNAAGDADIMFDDANINFVRECGGGGGVYRAAPGIMMPRNKVIINKLKHHVNAAKPC